MYIDHTYVFSCTGTNVLYLKKYRSNKRALRTRFSWILQCIKNSNVVHKIAINRINVARIENMLKIFTVFVFVK